MTHKIRVLAVTNTYPTDETPGDTPCIRDQILALRDRSVDVAVLRVDRCQRRLSYVKAAKRLFMMTFQPRRYDLIHAYYGHSGLVARLQFAYPVVVTFRGSDLLGRKDGAIGKVVARLVDGVIVMSEEMKRVAGRSDARVIPFGVNRSLFAPYPLKQARSELGLPLDDRLILFPWDPARPEKRFDLVEEAVRILRSKRERVRLLVVFDRPHHVVAKHMNACDAIVLASDHEGSPMAVREALSCNLPIVSVDVGDVRQVIGDVDGCYLCRQEAGDLAQKLGWVLDRGERTDGALVARMMDTASSAEQVIAVYKSMLNRRWVTRWCRGEVSTCE
jgi:glycosyltransferase involved in cell wall biosynthesis